MRPFRLPPVKNQKLTKHSHYSHCTFAAIMIVRGCKHVPTASATIFLSFSAIHLLSW